MRPSRRGVLLIVIQALLVSSIAGKFLCERKVCPRVWTRAAQVDPDSPLRGRYLILPLRVDACGLPKYDSKRLGPNSEAGVSEHRSSDVVARDGKLVAVENQSPAGGDRLNVWTPKNTSFRSRCSFSRNGTLYSGHSEGADAEEWGRIVGGSDGSPKGSAKSNSDCGEWERKIYADPV